MGWTLLTSPPKTSGRFIVAHRGYAKIISYMHPEGDYLPATKLGWREDPRDFGATHYQPLPGISHKKSAAAEKDLKARGLKRVVAPAVRVENVPAFKPTRWDYFKAAFGWTWLPSYMPTIRRTTTPAPKSLNDDPRQIVKKT